jgi:glycosyltransferase domain-containing protein
MVVLDSSSDATPAEIKAFFKESKIMHRQFDPSTDRFIKMLEGIKAVQTPMVVLWGDDDFLIPSAVRTCVDFLESHQDYSIAHGMAGAFHYDFNASEGSIKATSSYLQRSILLEKPSQRLEYHLLNYSTMFYSVQRTHELLRNMQLCCDGRFGWGFSEILLSSLSVVEGKVHKIDRLYLLRGIHAGMNTLDESGQKMNVFTWVVSSDFSAYYKKFLDILVAELVTREKISTEAAHDLLQRAFWGHLSGGLKKAWISRYAGRRSWSKSFGNRLQAQPKLAKYIYPLAKAVHDRFFVRDPLHFSKISMKNSPYHEEFLKVLKSVQLK